MNVHVSLQEYKMATFTSQCECHLSKHRPDLDSPKRFLISSGTSTVGFFELNFVTRKWSMALKDGSEMVTWGFIVKAWRMLETLTGIDDCISSPVWGS